jgi:hypothetical protein
LNVIGVEGNSALAFSHGLVKAPLLPMDFAQGCQGSTIRIIQSQSLLRQLGSVIQVGFWFELLPKVVDLMRA